MRSDYAKLVFVDIALTRKCSSHQERQDSEERQDSHFEDGLR